MSWSLSYQRITHPELVDTYLLAVGKALYLSTVFEVKCKSILRIANLVQAVQDDPIITLEQAMSELPSDKMLGKTLEGILQHSIARGEDTAEIFDKARKARNCIAHEGANAGGPVCQISLEGVLNQTDLLRSAVRDLIVGDNLISSWCYEIEAKQRAPRDFVEAYPRMAYDWVFAKIDDLLDRADPADYRRLSLREMVEQRQGR